MFTKIELKWGVIFALMQLLWITLEFAVGLHDKYISWHPILTNFVAIPSIIIMVLAILEKRKESAGRITLGKAFLCGLGVSIVVAILSPITQVIFHSLINPGYFVSLINYAVESGNATLEQARSSFNLTSYIIQSVIGALVIGTITSLIIAAVIKKDLRNI